MMRQLLSEIFQFLNRSFWVGFLFVLFLGLFSPSFAAAEKSFGGVGLQVVPTSTGELVVLSVIPGSSADLEQILPGDLIVKVDGTPLLGSDFNQVVRNKLWGEVGSSLVLEFMRPGKLGLHRKSLKRSLLVSPGTDVPQVQMIFPEKSPKD